MVVLDFLIYYLTHWFERKRKSLSWSTPTEAACYVAGLMTMALLYSINDLFEHGNIKSLQFHFSKILYVVIAIAIMALYQYIYTTRNRYQTIVKKIPNKFNISDDTGTIICIAFAFLTILSPFIVIAIVVPFGSGHTV